MFAENGRDDCGSVWKNELLSTRMVMGWRVCIDYRKLNKVTSKDIILSLSWIGC